MTEHNQEKQRIFRLRRLTRFSLRTALIAMTVLTVWLAWHMRSVRQQRASVEAIRRADGSVWYDYQLAGLNDLDPAAESPVPKWLSNMLGRDHFHSVAIVRFQTGPVTRSSITAGRRNAIVGTDSRRDGLLRHLMSFSELRALTLLALQATDSRLKHVGQVENLRFLSATPAHSVTDRGVAHLANLRQLDTLILHDAQITDKSLKILSQLPNLRHLSISAGHGENRLTNNGLAYLENTTTLETLDLHDSGITNDGLHHLVGLHQLKLLYLRGSKVDDASWLKNRLPNCKVVL